MKAGLIQPFKQVYVLVVVRVVGYDNERGKGNFRHVGDLVDQAVVEADQAALVEGERYLIRFPATDFVRTGSQPIRRWVGTSRPKIDVWGSSFFCLNSQRYMSRAFARR